jgi:FkbM family methyltransferase
MNSLVSAVNIIDPDQMLKSNLTCVKTKELLNLYSTTICVHLGRDAVSHAISTTGIWEEGYITRLLRILIRNPHLDMIDIGANIGTYTMFTAGALGRFTLAIDCFMPNIERIARAVQIRGVQNRVVLVQNALYEKSGEYLKLSNSLPSGLYLTKATQMDSVSEYVVKTIRLDDLLPILIEKGVRSALIKIDIEGSESYLCETGSKVFELIDIQLVMMEWGHTFRIIHKKRYQTIIDFFVRLKYVPTNEDCKVLNPENWKTTWPGNIYWVKPINFGKNIC